MSKGETPVPAGLVARGSTATAKPAAVLRRIAVERMPAVLESTRAGDQFGRYSVYAFDPVSEIVIRKAGSPHIFEQLSRSMSRAGAVSDMHENPPIGCGWIGFICYEAGLAIEGIKGAALQDRVLPAARFLLYDAALVYDHLKERWHISAVDWSDGEAIQQLPIEARIDRFERLLQSAGDDRQALKNSSAVQDRSVCRSGRFAEGRFRFELDRRHKESLELGGPQSDVIEQNMTDGEYLDRLAAIRRYIEAGDVYQVNLTRRFTVRTSASPFEVYLRLREASPSSHAAYLDWGELAILSSSPELFLRAYGGHVVTRPIKGTRRRFGESELDVRQRRDLAASEKDRAELNMIVDLLRNDLGRVCRYGSVRVVEPGEIEAHATVYHRVATIEGRLNPGRRWADLLRASFPGGSVTGAPKIRAMQMISQLEPTPRGVYCGCIGWIGLDGSLAFNLAIRTMVQRGNEIDVYAGGGIVADSKPDAEHEEVMTKLRGMLLALNCEMPGTRTDRVSTMTGVA